MTAIIRTSNKKARLLFQQGPMNNQEAATVSAQYKKRGNDVVITPAFEGSGVCVFVYAGDVKHG